MADRVSLGVRLLVALTVPLEEAVWMGERIGARVRSLVEGPCDCEDELPHASHSDVSAMLREAEGYAEGGSTP